MVSNQYVIVVGCGRLGALLASRLSSLGSSVVVIDRQQAAFENLSTDFSGFRVAGDAAELDVLRQARIDRTQCLLAVTSYDNLNLMVAQVAQAVFGVRKVMARVNNPSREAVYREFGIETICPATLSAAAFLSALGSPGEAGQP
ncbi:MAG: potassium channel family protein [Anaerolineae bacterium]|jgi:trk system potassium uptake protein TrkA